MRNQVAGLKLGQAAPDLFYSRRADEGVELTSGALNENDSSL